MPGISINTTAKIITPAKFQKRCESLLKQKFVRFTEDEKVQIKKISKNSDISNGFEQMTVFLNDKIENIQSRFSDLLESGRKLPDGKYIPGIITGLNGRRKLFMKPERSVDIFDKTIKYHERVLKFFSDFVYKPSSNLKIAIIEQNIRKKGIKAKFSENTHEDFAKLCQSALQDLENRGYELPKRIIYSPFLRLNTNALVLMSPNKQAETIFFSPKIVGKNFKEIKDYIEMKHADGTFSTSNPKHIIFHETGHRLHTKTGLKELFIQNFSAYANVPGSKPVLSENDNELLKNSVSGYAASSGIEAVAEIFAGLIDGKTYPPEVMEIYHRLKGPVPKTK